MSCTGAVVVYRTLIEVRFEVSYSDSVASAKQEQQDIDSRLRATTVRRGKTKNSENKIHKSPRLYFRCCAPLDVRRAVMLQQGCRSQHARHTTMAGCDIWMAPAVILAALKLV